MAVELLDLSEQEFVRRLALGGRGDLDPGAVASMYAHYGELRRWNKRLALVGAGMAGQAVQRLFGESVAALELLAPSARTLVDVGSGAGFPGLVIAAARPDLRVALVEPRSRKWAFLRAAAERASLSVDCVNARVSSALPAGLPERIDHVTVRALRLGAAEMKALAERLGDGGSILLWSSDGLAPAGFEIRRALDLAEGRGQVLELEPSSQGESE